jgi:putative flippase GtrA
MKLKSVIKGLYCGKTEDTKIQIYRSTQSSQYSYLLDLGLYILMVNVLFVPYPVARFISYMIGTTMSYILSILWIFPSRNVSNRLLEYGGFASIGVLGAGENILLMAFLKESFGMYHVHANIIASMAVFFVSFFIRKMLLFRKSYKE